MRSLACRSGVGQQSQSEDEAAGYKWWEDPEHPSWAEDFGDGGDEADEDAPTLPPPGWERRKVVEEADEEPRVRTVKDEGWD